MKKLILTFALLLFVINNGLMSAESLKPYYRFGLYGDFQYNFHFADFGSVPDCPICGPHFKSGNGLGAAIGGLFEIPLSKMFAIGARLSYSIDNAKFKKTDIQKVNYLDQIFDAQIEQNFDAKLSSIGFAPLFSIRFIDFLQIHLGARLGYYVVADYSTSENLIAPPGGYFENGTRTRNNVSGSLSNVNLMLSAMAGVSYEFPLNQKKTIFLAPEAFVLLGLQNVVKDVSWTPNSLRIGLALKFAPSGTHHAKEYQIDTVQVRSNKYAMPTIVEGEEFTSEKTEVTETNEKIIIKQVHRVDTLFTPALYAKLVTTAIGENGIRGKVTDIHVSTQFVTEVFPVLPYVFFERKSSQIPSRYEIPGKTQEFDFDNVEPNPVIIQRNVLNIIGKRMQDKPGTTISLQGTADPTTETGDCNLATTRAQVVRNYLVKTWGIAEDRIILKTLKEPCPPSSVTQSQNEDGYADNRRVEITSNDKDILQSIPSKRFNEPYKVTPPVIEHDPAGSSTDGIVSWMLIGSQGSNQLFTKSGDGPPTKIEHKISNKTALEMKADMPIQLTYIIKDKDGKTATATEEFNVTKDTSEIEVKRLSLTVFNVGSAEVTKTAGEEIKKFIQNMDEDSQISIMGYTDRLGDENFNMNLSRNRAGSIRDYVQKLSPKAKITSTVGLAFTNYPPGIFSYSTPEERFLSRTVQIEVRHKTKK